jgi:hypothetical protein
LQELFHLPATQIRNNVTYLENLSFKDYRQANMKVNMEERLRRF